MGKITNWSAGFTEDYWTNDANKHTTVSIKPLWRVDGYSVELVIRENSVSVVDIAILGYANTKEEAKTIARRFMRSNPNPRPGQTKSAQKPASLQPRRVEHTVRTISELKKIATEKTVSINYSSGILRSSREVRWEPSQNRWYYLNTTTGDEGMLTSSELTSELGGKSTLNRGITVTEM